jgi:Uma2 family endonuclease
VPLDGDVFLTFIEMAWRRDVWDAQPAGLERGGEWCQRHADVILNLWQLFGELCAAHGGIHSGRVDVALSSTSAVAPDQCYFRKPREECMIEGDYFQGTPDLVAEVLSPASRWIDRGPRKELYRRHAVGHLWLLDPEVESVDVYELEHGAYRLAATYHAGEAFEPRLFPGAHVEVAALFDTQEKRWRNRISFREPDPIPDWLVPPDKQLGLEYLFLLGHPERRWEIWGNRAPSVLPFGSPEEARVRFHHFLEEVCRWEGVRVAAPSCLGTDEDLAEVGRFHLKRRGRHVHLDVAVDARKYRELLHLWGRRDAWDWGE